MSKSVDLRKAAVIYRLQGHTLKETGQVFGVSVSAVREWVRKYQETGDLSDRPPRRRIKKIDPARLRAYVRAHPDQTQAEIAAVFGCRKQAISKAMKRLGITRRVRAGR